MLHKAAISIHHEERRPPSALILHPGVPQTRPNIGCIANRGLSDSQIIKTIKEYEACALPEHIGPG